MGYCLGNYFEEGRRLSLRGLGWGLRGLGWGLRRGVVYYV